MKLDIVSDKRLSIEEGSHYITDAILHQKPFSLIRVGEGEATFMQNSSQWTARLLGWRQKHYFGTDKIILDDWFRLSEDIKNAMSNSDLICFPLIERILRSMGQPGHFAERYVLLTALSTRMDFSDNTKQCGEVNLAYALNNSGKLFEWMEMASQILVITSQPIITNLQRLYPGKLQAIKIPGRAIDNASIENTLHFPDHYDMVLRQISGIKRGTLVMVGAGPCGKPYCDYAKKAGGIALDLGALFDVWGGHITRPCALDPDGLFNKFDKPSGWEEKSECSPNLLLTTENIYTATRGKIDKRHILLEPISHKISPFMNHTRTLAKSCYDPVNPYKMAAIPQASINKQVREVPQASINKQVREVPQASIDGRTLQVRDDLYASFLWKITSPFRKLSNLIKGE